MRAIIVEDEAVMLRCFNRTCKDIEDLNIVGSFDDSLDALDYVRNHSVDVAFLDVEMPIMNGIELAEKLKIINPKIMIVFVTAFDNYIKDSNDIGADYYIVKPYKRETIERIVTRLKYFLTTEEMELEKKKDIFIQTFGRFTVFHNGVPIPLVGKAKEILALIVTKRGKEISNEEIYSLMWENRVYDNVHMKVYYNALKRLRTNLEKAGISHLLISTSRGQLANVDAFDCDYYVWQDGDREKYRFEGEFLSEYSWAEGLLANMVLD